MSQWTVHIAVYAVLAGDPVLDSMTTGIVDQPEQNQGYPYVLIGESTMIGDDILNADGEQHTMTLHIWDKDQPISRAKQIMDRIKVLLHNKKLVITDTQSVSCRIELSEVQRDVDTIHGVMRFRVLTFG